jgi:hypothetical protein
MFQPLDSVSIYSKRMRNLYRHFSLAQITHDSAVPSP